MPKAKKIVVIREVLKEILIFFKRLKRIRGFMLPNNIENMVCENCWPKSITKGVSSTAGIGG